MDILTIKSQIKSPYFNMILKIAKSSQTDLKSDFVKSSIKLLNTLDLHKRATIAVEALGSERQTRADSNLPLMSKTNWMEPVQASRASSSHGSTTTRATLMLYWGRREVCRVHRAV
jgi:hypothetical protein